MSKSRRKIGVLAALLLVVLPVIISIAALCIGRISYSPGEIISALRDGILGKELKGAALDHMG